MNTDPETPTPEDEIAGWARLMEDMEETPPEPVEIQEDLFRPVTRALVRGEQP